MARRNDDGDDYVSRSDYDELFEALEQETEAHKATKKAADKVPELEKRLGELTGKVRGRAHRDAFEKLADELKVSKDPAKRADLYALSKWAEDSDEPETKAMRKHFEPLLESRKYLLDDAAAGAEKPAGEEKPLAAEADAGRGGTTTPPGRFTVRSADLSNEKWMRANQEAYTDAVIAGTLNIVP